MDSTIDRRKVGRPKKTDNSPKPTIPKRPEDKVALEYELDFYNVITNSINAVPTVPLQ